MRNKIYEKKRCTGTSDDRYIRLKLTSFDLCRGKATWSIQISIATMHYAMKPSEPNPHLVSKIAGTWKQEATYRCERYIDTVRPREPRSFSEPREKVIARACKMVGVLGSVHVLTRSPDYERAVHSRSLFLCARLGSPVVPQLHLSPTPHVAFPHCPPFFHRVFVLVEPRTRARATDRRFLAFGDRELGPLPPLPGHTFRFPR